MTIQAFINLKLINEMTIKLIESAKGKQLDKQYKVKYKNIISCCLRFE
jgi:hypothetical protein